MKMEVQKAKIVDLNAEYAVVLTDSGAFKRISRKGDMSVGGGIYITDRDLYLKTKASKSFALPIFNKRLLQVTGVLALLIMILFTQSLSPITYAVISVDINPSIQLFIDSDYNVVKIESMNADGRKLLSEYDFTKHQSASSVLTELFTLASKMDYLKADQNEILIAAAIYKPSKVTKAMLQPTNETDRLIEAVLSEVDYSIFEKENVVINSVASNSKNIEAAEKEHLSIGQYEKDHHSETVKPYAIVEEGKHTKPNKEPNGNANAPADTSNEGIKNNGDKVNNNNIGNNDNEDHDNAIDGNNGVGNDDDHTNGNSNNSNSGNNGSNSNENNGNKNNIEIKKPNAGINNVKNNVENSNFAGGKNKKQFQIEKSDDARETTNDLDSNNDKNDKDFKKDNESHKNNN
jgi:hypothetical protein